MTAKQTLSLPANTRKNLIEPGKTCPPAMRSNCQFLTYSGLPRVASSAMLAEGLPRHSAPAGHGFRESLSSYPAFRPRQSLPDRSEYVKLRSGVSSVLVAPSRPEAGVVEANVQEWPATAALIIAEVIGSGVLALGGQMAVVGLVPLYMVFRRFMIC